MRTLTVLTVVFMAGLAASGAKAGVVTQTGTVSDTKTDYTDPFTVTGGANASTFAGFNTALGTLTGVTIDFTVNGTESGTLTNSSGSSQTFKFFSDSNLSAIDAGSSAPAALTNYLASGLTLSEKVNQYVLAGGASTSILPAPNAFGNGTLTESTTFTGAAADQFIGKNFALDLTTFTTTTFQGGGGNIVTAITTIEGGDLSIVYDYTPINTVPEPSSLAALGAGLLGLTALRFRKRV